MRNCVQCSARLLRWPSRAVCLLAAALVYLPAGNSCGSDLITEPVDAARLTALPQVSGVGKRRERSLAKSQAICRFRI